MGTSTSTIPPTKPAISNEKAKTVNISSDKDSLFLYVLKLKGGKYYVGSTNNVQRRLAQHKAGRATDWTEKYPVLELMYSRVIESVREEDQETKKMMGKYKIENVRGGSYCQIILPDYAIKSLTVEICHANGCCFKCGEKGHFAKDCGVSIVLCCERCNFNSHSIERCNAFTKKDGSHLCSARTKVGNRCKRTVAGRGILCITHNK